MITEQERNGQEDFANDALPFVDAADLIAQPYKEPAFLIEHLVPRQSVILLSADSGAGKTSFLMHAALSLAVGLPVAGRFGTFQTPGRPALFVNGEMGADAVVRFLQANAIGIGVSDIPSQGLLFQGEGGLSDFFLPNEHSGGAARRLERLLEDLNPELLILDTLRGLFEADESKTKEVRAVFTWLRALTERFGISIIVAHHLRKIAQIGNGARERVSGSRDIIASVDVHLAMRAASGHPVSALLMDKTRFPFSGVNAGTEWPIEARWSDAFDDAPPRSTFIAGEPTGTEIASSDESKADIIALLTAEGPRTKAEMDANSGTRRRALDTLRDSGQVVEAGKRGRAILFSLPGHAFAELDLAQ